MNADFKCGTVETIFGGGGDCIAIDAAMCSSFYRGLTPVQGTVETNQMRIQVKNGRQRRIYLDSAEGHGACDIELHTQP